MKEMDPGVKTERTLLQRAKLGPETKIFRKKSFRLKKKDLTKDAKDQNFLTVEEPQVSWVAKQKPALGLRSLLTLSFYDLVYI